MAVAREAGDSLREERQADRVNSGDFGNNEMGEEGGDGEVLAVRKGEGADVEAQAWKPLTTAESPRISSVVLPSPTPPSPCARDRMNNTARV